MVQTFVCIICRGGRSQCRCTECSVKVKVVYLKSCSKAQKYYQLLLKVSKAKALILQTKWYFVLVLVDDNSLFTVVDVVGAHNVV